MKRIIIGLVLALGGALSAFAGACSQGATNVCAAAADGTTFTLSLISLTTTSMTPAVNVNVVARDSGVFGTDYFTVTVSGSQRQSLSGSGMPAPLAAGMSLITANFDVAVSGQPGAAVTDISTATTGRSVTTDVAPTGTTALAPWSTQGSPSAAASDHPITPTFVSAEIDNGLLPSGTASGFTETFTVVWTAYHPAIPPPSTMPFIIARDPFPFINEDPAVSIAPEPASFGLMIFAGGLGGLLLRRRLSKR
jgi:hypothetical protein